MNRDWTVILKIEEPCCDEARKTAMELSPAFKKKVKDMSCPDLHAFLYEVSYSPTLYLRYEEEVQTILQTWGRCVNPKAKRRDQEKDDQPSRGWEYRRTLGLE